MPLTLTEVPDDLKKYFRPRPKRCGRCYVCHLVEVFREIRRVLRDDGTVWLNIGDSYMSHQAKDRSHNGGFTGDRMRADGEYDSAMISGKPKVEGLKDKDLVGIPWRAALALQADGWYLRNAIIWHKKNHMPHPVRDRLVCSYEMIFLLTKQAHYYFDLDAIRIPHTYGSYDEGGNFEPHQKWFEIGEGTRKMDQTDGQLGTMAGPPRRVGWGLYNPGGKNPGDHWSFPEERLNLIPLAGQRHVFTLGVDELRDTATFVGRVVDQFVDAASRVGAHRTGTDAAVLDEPVSEIVQEFLRTRPHQPNLVVFRGTPYATVTVEQTPNEVTIQFGRNVWVFRNEGLSRDDTKRSEVICHSFAVNGQGVDTLLVLVNWMRGLPLPSNVLDQLQILRGQAYRDLCATRPSPKDAPVSNHQSKDVRPLRGDVLEVAFIEGVLAVLLDQVRIAMSNPPFVVEAAKAPNTGDAGALGNGTGGHWPILHLGSSIGNLTGDVWDFPTQPFPGAHFAVWPSSIPERCILAGTSEKGCCPTCGSPWQRVVEKGEPVAAKGGKPHSRAYTDAARMGTDSRKEGVLADEGSTGSGFGARSRTTVGWEPSCQCPEHTPVRCKVLDPFSGSGTTGMVAVKLNRDYVGLDLNASYLDMAITRISGEKVSRPKVDDEEDLIAEIFGRR